MKGKYLLVSALLSTLFVSCDWTTEYECYIDNKTQKNVTVTLSGKSNTPDYKKDPSLKINENGQITYTIAPDRRCLVAFDEILNGSPSRDYTERVALICFGDSLSFSFEDGTQLTYYKNDSIGDSPYNFDSDKYSYTQDERYWSKLVFKLE